MNSDKVIQQIIQQELTKDEVFIENSALIQKSIPVNADHPDYQRIHVITDLVSSCVEQFSAGNTSSINNALELGVGYGSLLRSLANIFPNIKWSGVEHPERSYLKDDSYWQFLANSNCELKLCNITREKLPFEDSSFDLVTFSEVLEHLPTEHVLLVLREISRVLRSSGYLIISSPNQAYVLNRLTFLKGKSLFDLPIPLTYAGDTFGHIRLYTVDEMRKLAEFVGFKSERVLCRSRYKNNFQYDRKWKQIMTYFIMKVTTQFTKQDNFMGDSWYMTVKKL